MEFPTREEDIIALAKKIIEGLKKHPDLFPSPPISADELQKQLDNFIASKKAEEAAQAALVQSTIARNAAFSALRDIERQSEQADGGAAMRKIWN